MLPDFELKTIKAVQTIAGQKSEFETWFDALESMKDQISKTDFDIAIIGCGAYGFPLASYVKDLGKQAIHLGGVTQLLFGIKGKRWEEWEHYTELRKNNGENWIFTQDIPKDFEKIYTIEIKPIFENYWLTNMGPIHEKLEAKLTKGNNIAAVK